MVQFVPFLFKKTKANNTTSISGCNCYIFEGVTVFESFDIQYYLTKIMLKYSFYKVSFRPNTSAFLLTKMFLVLKTLSISGKLGM